MMRVKRLDIARSGLAAVAAMFSAPSAFAQSTAITSSYWDTSLSFNRCMDQTQRVLGELSFTNINRLNTAVGGGYGDYVAQVICLTAKGMIIAIVTGPDANTANQHVQAISQKLQAVR